MNNYDFLKQYIYKDYPSSKSDENNSNGHVFLLFKEKDLQDIKKLENEISISYSTDLINLYSDVGIGQLYAKFRDNYKYRYRFLWPMELLALYNEDYDEDEEFGGSRRNALDSLAENNRLSFMEASEHDFFEISLDDESIWIFGRKIANSLEEFLIKVLEEPDYHHKKNDM